MSWYKYQSNQQIVNKIKQILLNHPLPRKMLETFGLSSDDIKNHLKIIFEDLDKQYAKGNSDEIVLDKKLLNDNFLEDHFHFVVHELYHWIKRRKEKENYFHDTEEIESFVMAIVWEMIKNKNPNDIYNVMFPIISSHFNRGENAKKIFKIMIEKANKIYKKWNL